MSIHCLVCNMPLKDLDKPLNVFNLVDCPMNRLLDGRTQSNTLFEIIAQILNRPQSSIILHSQVLCQGCYLNVLAIMDVKEKLLKLQADLMSSFDQTAFARTELASTNDLLQQFTGTIPSHSSEIKTEESSLENLANIDFEDTSTSIDIKDSIKQDDIASVPDTQKPVISLPDNQESVLDKSPKSRKYVCEKCGKTFSGNSHWVEHMLIHIDVKPHVCSFCNKNFRTLSMLKVHERGHMGLKPYECKVCGKAFNERHYLSEHAIVHADRKPFKCNVCGREFVRRKDMVTHTKLHSEERPYCCPHCPKKFVVRSRLNRHIKTHDSNRPYECKICSKTFARQQEYQNHQTLHTGLKPFQCPQCGKSFGSLSNFRAHERRHKRTAKEKADKEKADKEKAAVAAFPIGDPLSDPLELRSTTELDQLSAKANNEAPVVTNSKIVKIESQDLLPPAEPVIFQPDDVVKGPQRLPSLVSFKTPSDRTKTPGLTIPINADVSTVTLPGEESGVTTHQPLVFMQFPLPQEPPPLILYSAPRNPEQAMHLANSILAEPSSNNAASQLQVLRWDNVEDVLFQDNSNGSLLTQTLF